MARAGARASDRRRPGRPLDRVSRPAAAADLGPRTRGSHCRGCRREHRRQLLRVYARVNEYYQIMQQAAGDGGKQIWFTELKEDRAIAGAWSTPNRVRELERQPPRITRTSFRVLIQ